MQRLLFPIVIVAVCRTGWPSDVDVYVTDCTGRQIVGEETVLGPEKTNSAAIFASPGEYEPFSFALQPKERLVDVMEDVPHMPSIGDIKGILNEVVAGFEHATEGAGIQVYWVLHEENATPHEEFADVAAMETWASDHQDNGCYVILLEFVHLMFADKWLESETPGRAGTFGAYVFVERAWDRSQTGGYSFHGGLKHTAAHEVTHCLLNTAGDNGFDGNEHLDNPDPSDPQRSANDKKYLMYFQTTPENRTSIIFSNPTREQLNLTSRQSVER